MFEKRKNPKSKGLRAHSTTGMRCYNQKLEHKISSSLRRGDVTKERMAIWRCVIFNIGSITGGTHGFSQEGEQWIRLNSNLSSGCHAFQGSAKALSSTFVHSTCLNLYSLKKSCWKDATDGIFIFPQSNIAKCRIVSPFVKFVLLNVYLGEMSPQVIKIKLGKNY